MEDLEISRLREEIATYATDLTSNEPPQCRAPSYYASFPPCAQSSDPTPESDQLKVWNSHRLPGEGISRGDNYVATIR